MMLNKDKDPIGFDENEFEEDILSPNMIYLYMFQFPNLFLKFPKY